MFRDHIEPAQESLACSACAQKPLLNTHADVSMTVKQGV